MICFTGGARGTTGRAHNSGGTTVRPLLAGGGGGSPYLQDYGGEPSTENKVYSSGSVALGDGNKIYGKQSMAFGYGNTVKGDYNTVVGKNNYIGEQIKKALVAGYNNSHTFDSSTEHNGGGIVGNNNYGSTDGGMVSGSYARPQWGGINALGGGKPGQFGYAAQANRVVLNDYTTDGTTKDSFFFSTCFSNGSLSVMDGVIGATDSGGDNTASWKCQAQFRKANGAYYAEGVAVSQLHYTGGGSGWSVGFTASYGSVVAQLTGDAGATLQWVGSFNFAQFYSAF